MNRSNHSASSVRAMATSCATSDRYSRSATESCSTTPTIIISCTTNWMTRRPPQGNRTQWNRTEGKINAQNFVASKIFKHSCHKKIFTKLYLNQQTFMNRSKHSASSVPSMATSGTTSGRYSLSATASSSTTSTIIILCTTNWTSRRQPQRNRAEGKKIAKTIVLDL